MAAEELVLNVKSDIGDVVKQTEKLDGATKKGKKGFQGIGKAVKGVGVALKAAGIGIIVALLAKLMEVFSKNQNVLDAFETGMTALSIAFNDLFKVINENIEPAVAAFKALFEDPQKSLKEFGDMIQDNLIERFNSLLDTFGYVGSALSSLFKGKFKEAAKFAKLAGKEMVDVATGIDDSFDKASTVIVDYTKKTLKQAAAITELNKAALLAEVQFAKLNAEFLRDAEIQRQIRDDVSKTFAVRIAANEELSKVLAKQSEAQKAQLQIQIDSAQAAVNMNNSIENRVALGQAENAMLELKEAITGQISEQLTNQTALEEELRVGREQSLAEGTSGLERELEELRLAYEEKKRLADKSGVDTTAITSQYQKEQLAITQTINDAKLASQLSLVSAMGSSIKALGGLFEEGTKASKAAALAEIAINTGVGLIQGLNIAQKSAAAAGPGAALAFPIFYATQLAAVLGAAAQAKTILGAGGGGGGGGVSAEAPPAPQMMSGAFDISGGVAPEAMKAFVVTDEMSNSQNQLANIRRRATI